MTDTVERTYTGPLNAGTVGLPDGRSAQFTNGVPVEFSAADAKSLDPEVWVEKPSKTKADKATDKAAPATSKEARP